MINLLQNFQVADRGLFYGKYPFFLGRRNDQLMSFGGKNLKSGREKGGNVKEKEEREKRKREKGK
jgi:hypothetical protein